MIRVRARSLWPALVLVVGAGACRGRAPSMPAVDWKRPGDPAEAAAALLLDQDGVAKVVCVPSGQPAREPFGTIALRRILDVAWDAQPIVVGTTVTPDGELVLLRGGAGPRSVAKGARAARFSPDGTALAYEVAPGPSGDGTPNSHVLDMGSGKVTDLGAVVDPRWGADGKQLFVTRVRTPAEEAARAPGHWKSLRVRWERASGELRPDGPGSAQIPAPVGEGVAWSERPPGAPAVASCSVVLTRQGGVRHSVVGSFCAGMADDRAVRWSPDGHWLAFVHPGPLPGRRERSGFFVDVVSIEGGRSPALSAIHALARPDQIAVAAGSTWFDWSPSGRFLILQDGANELRLYDFQAPGIARLGKGQTPTWSPGGQYLLMLDGGVAFVRSGVSAEDRIALGPARDARWLPAQACERRQ